MNKYAKSKEVDLTTYFIRHPDPSLEPKWLRINRAPIFIYRGPINKWHVCPGSYISQTEV